MQSSTIRINGRSNIVKLAALFGFGAYLAILVEINFVASFLFACSLLSVVANYLFFISARNRVRIEDIVLLLLTFLSVIMSDWQLNFDYYKPAIVVFCTVLCIDLCVEVEVGAKDCRSVTSILMLVTLITNIQYYFGGLRYSYHGSTSAIALNFSNPNETAMWLVFIIVFLCDSVPAQKKLRTKLLQLVGMLSLLPLLYRTEARNCFIAVAFFFVGKIVLWVSNVRKIPNWSAFLIALAPVLVYLGYMYIFIPNYDRMSEWLRFLQSEGKSLTSRFRIWSSLEMGNWKFVLFGNYGVYHSEQLHNAMVTLYCRFGIFYVIIVCRKLYRVLKKMPNAGMQLALGTILLTGCFESSIFVGIAGMYVLVLLLPVFHQKGSKTAA